MPDSQQPTGVIENIPLLDLSHATWAEDFDRLTRIANVGAVVVPDSLSHALAGVEMENVGAIIPVPTGSHVRIHTGGLMIGGAALAEPDGDNEVLIVTGALIVTSPITRIRYREVVVTGLVLAPRGSESALGAALTRVTGSVSYYRYAEGQEFKQLAGDVRLSGASLANPGGSPDDVLLLAGEVIVTSPVERVGYQRIYYGGSLVLPEVSEPELMRVLSGGGRLAWYSGQPRFFNGDAEFGREFFELLEEPISLALVGEFQITDDVPVELVRRKVKEITLVGNLTAPRDLIPVLQVLTTQKYGELAVAAGDHA
jgi:hypothetical protein